MIVMKINLYNGESRLNAQTTPLKIRIYKLMAQSKRHETAKKLLQNTKTNSF
jgi:hypothetical protein